MNKKIKPIAYRISQCGSCTEIIYMCPRCHASFAILGDRELFCHNCGAEIDWNVYESLKEPLKNSSPEKEKRLLDYVNQENKRKKSE